MVTDRTRAVVVDTMAVSALLNAARKPEPATALRLGVELISDDAIYQGVPGLRVVSG